MAATLPSNRADAQIVVEFGETIEYAHEPGFESSIHLRGHHWDGDHRFPFSTWIRGVWLRSADLEALRDHIARWTALPLDRLDAEELDGDFWLAGLPGQRLHFRFGSRLDTISQRNPVVSIAFSAGALQGEFHFVTDQSCLALFAKELSAELTGFRENRG